MLQRAASNAYSWWWAGHIRTKQSKWLEQSLQDMEEKVEYVLKLIEEDGDSFAKRAEMYYKKRPELTGFVEESYRAFRALAERYDHLSTELQNANNTLATCFPDQIELAMHEDDDFGTPRIPRIPPQVPAANASNVPMVPKAPTKDLKGLLQKATKQLQNKKSSKGDASKKTTSKSGLSKAEAAGEIDKLQKDILTLQTQKEFLKSSYKSGLEKYWSIENQIMEKQQKVCGLQDEFMIDKAIDDDEARKLMAETALKSCQETLVQLQETQEKSARIAREEYERIEAAQQKLKSLRHKFLHDQTDEEKPQGKDKPTKIGDTKPSSDQDLAELIQEKQKTEVIQEKVKEQYGSVGSITVRELVEKIDELVNKVVSLETGVSCQTALIDRLKSESDELHVQIQILEDDRATLKEGTQELKERVKELEEKLSGILDLGHKVENQTRDIQSQFVEAQSSLGHLSKNLSHVKPENELDIDSSHPDNASSWGDVSLDQESSHPRNAPQKEQEKQKDLPSGGNGSLDPSKIVDADVKKEQETRRSEEEENKLDVGSSSRDQERSLPNNSPQKEQEKQNNLPSGGNSNPSEISDVGIKKEQEFSASANGREGECENCSNRTVKLLNPTQQVKKEEQSSSQLESGSHRTEPKEVTENEEFNWQTMLLTGEEDKEKILLTEYTELLKNYKDVKRKLIDIEKQESDGKSEVSAQNRELKSAIAKRDEEIQRLSHKLNSLQESSSDNKDAKEERPNDAIPEDEDINLIFIDQPEAISHIEEKLRMDIDAILEENLDFWLRFSASFHRIQNFKSTVVDLQDDISKIREKKKQEESATSSINSDVRPIYKHLKEIENELTAWLQQSVSLKDELERRSSSLCNIQEKITLALKEGVEEEEIIFSSHQAAKFQGEVLNMKQENNKVREELQAGVEHITLLQVEVDRTLRKLNEEFGLSGDHSSGRARVPLRSFIFGTKPKKQKSSIFSSLHGNRKYQVLRAGVPL